MYVQFSMFISLLVSYTVLCKKIRFFTEKQCILQYTKVHKLT